MTAQRSRLEFIARVVRREVHHLLATDTRLFKAPLTVAETQSLEQQEEFAERIEAFVGRFGRLQDTLGDKLLPNLLVLLGERNGSVIDNLDRAERFGWIESANGWMEMRSLRNQMVHEYIEDAAILTDALNSGHRFVRDLVETAERLLDEMALRMTKLP